MFTKFFTGCFSFLNFSIKIVFSFVDPIYQNFVWSLRLTDLIKLSLFIFKISQNHIVIFFVRWKQTGKINQSFTWKHKINESNAKTSTHYWIVWLYSKYVCFHDFMSNKIFNFLMNMLTISLGTVKINNFNFSTK